MTLPTSIRPVLQSEAAVLQKLAERTFLQAFGAANSTENMKSYVQQTLGLAKLQKEMENPNSYFFFAHQEEVLGYLKLNMGDAQTESVGEGGLEIERIYVSSEHQGKQVGASLLDHAVAFAKSHNSEFMWLGVWEHNPGAIRFYERHGFVAFDKHSFLLGDDPQVDVLMRRNGPF